MSKTRCIIEFRINGKNGGDQITHAEEIGIALKEISNRLRNYTPPVISEEEQRKRDCCHDCLKCRNYTRQESYNQSNGMVFFYNHWCEKGHKGKINSYFDGVECPDFDKGDNTLLFMSDEEKMDLGVSKRKPEDILVDNSLGIENVEKQLKSNGISIKNDDDTYKSLYDVLSDISKVVR